MSDRTLNRLMERCRGLVRRVQHLHCLPQSDCDDLEQEMAIALLSVDGEHTDSFYLARAVWRAVSWIRREYPPQGSVTFSISRDVAALIDSGHCRRVWC